MNQNIIYAHRNQIDTDGIVAFDIEREPQLSTNAISARYQDGLFEAETLMTAMRKSDYQVSKATLYRSIKLLREAGIIQEVMIDGKQSHYQLIYARKPIDTMVCMRTGERIEFSSGELIEWRDELCKEHGWDPVGHRVVIYALSPEDS